MSTSLPVVHVQDKLDFSHDSGILANGDIMHWSTIYNWTMDSSTVEGLFTLKTGDTRKRLAIHGRVVVHLCHSSEFLSEKVLEPDFLKFMSKQANISNTGQTVTISRSLPYIPKIVSPVVKVTGIYKKDVELASWCQIVPHNVLRRCSYSVGKTNLSKEKGFTIRLMSTHIDTEEGTILDIEYIAVRKPLLFTRFPRLVQPVFNWAVNTYVPKVIRRLRRYKTNEAEEEN